MSNDQRQQVIGAQNAAWLLAFVLAVAAGCGQQAVRMADPKTAAPPPASDPTPIHTGISPSDTGAPGTPSPRSP
jgi:hypothetical protein